ncbi:MAG: cobalamin-binding protein [Telluria sp.]
MTKASMLLAAVLALPAHAAITVVDDAGKAVTLAQPARRVISLSPAITELLFAAGGGSRVAGVMNYSDYPEAAKKLPIVGSNAGLDLESMIALKPDLIVAWQSGNTARQLETLTRLGVPVFYSDPHKLEEVATSLERLGALLGTGPAAGAAAQSFRAEVAALDAKYARRPPVRVFYQIWDKPVYTLNGEHIASDALRHCGGVNVFAGLKTIAPEVSVEAVLQENPEVILGGDQYDPADKGIGPWRRYKGLLAAQRNNLFSLHGELLTRGAPRITQGMRELCDKLELARQRRP